MNSRQSGITTKSESTDLTGQLSDSQRPVPVVNPLGSVKVETKMSGSITPDFPSPPEFGQSA